MTALKQLEIYLNSTLTEIQAEQFSTLFEDLGSSLTLKRSADDEWVLQIIHEHTFDSLDINRRLKIGNDVFEFDTKARFSIPDVPDIDWLEHVYQQFKPIQVGGFFIFGTHVKEPVPEGLIGIEINAANAFGTGEHPTTKGCLQALQDLKAQGFNPETILDLGCGSAILSIAAAKIWPEAKIIATDMDAESVEVALDYAGINNVAASIQAETALGYDSSLIKEEKSFDLILANILARPLIDMAEQTAHHLNQNGLVVLSGTLIEQQDDVQSAHETYGLTLHKAYPIEEWTSFVMKKV